MTSSLDLRRCSVVALGILLVLLVFRFVWRGRCSRGFSVDASGRTAMGRGREEADDEDAELLRCEPLSPLPAPLDFTELTSARVFFLALRFASFAPAAAELFFLLVAGRSGFPSAGTRVCAARGSTLAVGGFAFCCAATEACLRSVAVFSPESVAVFGL